MNVHVGHMRDISGEDLRVWLQAIIDASGKSLTRFAQDAGISHTTLSRALNPNEPPPNFRADTIAKLISLSGQPAPDSVRATGMAEPDVLPIAPANDDAAGHLGPDRHEWQVGASFSRLAGYRPGDRLLVDMAERPCDGDDVLVQIEDMKGGATTHLRRFRRGWVLAGPETEPEYVDGIRVRVAGVVVKSWRLRHN